MMTDADLNALFGQLAMKLRRDVVRSLLAGNDSCCFTTRQYLDRYVRDVDKGVFNAEGRPVSMMDERLARKHLLSVGMREVRPGVWAAVE